MNNPGSTPASLAAARSSTPYENPNHAIIELELLDPATGTGEVIETTDNHPFYVAERGWTRVDQLRLGDQIPTSHGNLLTVQRIYLSGRIESVYNFGVDDFHTYFVGEVGAWVHNCSFSEILKPNGELIGYAGSRSTTRRIAGTSSDAKSLFQQLLDENPGFKLVQGTDYPGGQLYQHANGDTLGFRTYATRSGQHSHNATIDIKVGGFSEIRKIKFE